MKSTQKVMRTQRMMILIIWRSKLAEKNSLNRWVGVSKVDKVGSGINRKKEQYEDMRLWSQSGVVEYQVHIRGA